jgi:hypothetical protein
LFDVDKKDVLALSGQISGHDAPHRACSDDPDLSVWHSLSQYDYLGAGIIKNLLILVKVREGRFEFHEHLSISKIVIRRIRIALLSD